MMWWRNKRRERDGGEIRGDVRGGTGKGGRTVKDGEIRREREEKKGIDTERREKRNKNNGEMGEVGC